MSSHINRKQRLRICYLSASAGDWGGASRVLFTNLKLLDRERFEPLVLLPRDGPIIGELDALGIRYVMWGNHHEPNGVHSYARDVIRAYRFFRRNHIDILHINQSNYWRPAEILAARMARIPIITHYHVVVDKPGPFVRFSERIIAVSEYVAKHSLPDAIKKEIVHNCVQVERFDQARSLRQELGYCDSDVVVSFIGQIRKIKGIESFLALARDIDEESARFLIAGQCRDPDIFKDSYTEEQLKKEIAESRRVQYVGYRSDIENIYKTSDIIIVPSRWDEPFGLINIEAGATRRPVVASRVGGIPEVISHGENGFLYDSDKIPALIEYTKRLIADRELRHKMGERARLIVERNFTHAPVRQLERVYESIASHS